jgi:hypothetical protein
VKTKTKRIAALLILAALPLMPIATTSANPTPWSWIPSTVHCLYVGNSNRTISVATAKGDPNVTNKTILYAGQQYSDMVFGKWGNTVPITVPKGSYYSAPFFLKTIGAIPFYIWCQVYLVKDGNGTLALAPGALKDVNINITVTGNGAGGFSVSTVRYGGSAPVGSCLLYMPLNMSVWLGTSQTDPTLLNHNPAAFLFNMNFTMLETTGFVKVAINDTHPYPSGKLFSMNGYRKNATGVPFNSTTGAAVFAGAGAGLDIYALLLGLTQAWTDYIFTDYGVMQMVRPAVGGIWIPVDKLALLAPYIGLVSATVLAVAAAGVFFKYRKKP